MAKLKKLTQAAARHIKKDVIGRCENPECSSTKSLHVHHIDGNRKNNVQSNLIVLCGECHHNAAHAGILNKTKQKKIVRNRSDKEKRAIRGILNATYKRVKKKTTKQEYEKEVESIFDRVGKNGGLTKGPFY